MKRSAIAASALVALSILATSVPAAAESKSEGVSSSPFGEFYRNIRGFYRNIRGF